MRKFKDLTGQKINNWKIIKHEGFNKFKQSLWLCECDCYKHTRRIKTTSAIRKNKDCGCTNFIDLTGQKFGKLTVIKRIENKKGRIQWLCKCDCGNEINVMSQCLLSGGTKSCGCITKERMTKHGMKGTRFYNIYSDLKQRCTNKNCKDYKRYGGRGITICDEWNDNFTNFYNDMYISYMEHCRKYGEENTSIDRIDVNGNYEPSNCRWATVKEQQNNTRVNRFIEINGVTKTISEWADYYNINYGILYGYIKRNKLNTFLSKIENKTKEGVK